MGESQRLLSCFIKGANNWSSQETDQLQGSWGKRDLAVRRGSQAVTLCSRCQACSLHESYPCVDVGPSVKQSFLSPALIHTPVSDLIKTHRLSVVKSTGCSSRGPELNSQHPHGSSQVSVTTDSSGIWHSNTKVHKIKF